MMVDSDVKESLSHLYEFLREEGLERFYSTFFAQEVDLQTFTTLTTEDLVSSFGITESQDIKDLLQAVDRAGTKYAPFMQEAARRKVTKSRRADVNFARTLPKDFKFVQQRGNALPHPDVQRVLEEESRSGARCPSLGDSGISTDEASGEETLDRDTPSGDVSNLETVSKTLGSSEPSLAAKLRVSGNK
jgi:hypothetical protein